MDLIPAMVLHGVKTRETIALRMLNVPRFIAEKMAPTVRKWNVSLEALGQWLDETDIDIWKESLPTGAKITGTECRHLWEIIEGKKSWKNINHFV
jgi:hypothetical protein